MKANRTWTLLVGAALGVSAMYLLDPGSGRRRRALVRDKARRTARKTGDSIERTSRHLANRTRGAAAELQRRLRADTADDSVMMQRIRSAIGRAASHPHALEVTVHDGRARLSGPILASEVDAVLAKARAVRGIADVENALEVHDSPANTPALQGAGRRTGSDDNWAALARLIVGVGSAVALGAGLAKTSATPMGAARL